MIVNVEVRCHGALIESTTVWFGEHTLVEVPTPDGWTVVSCRWDTWRRVRPLDERSKRSPV